MKSKAKYTSVFVTSTLGFILLTSLVFTKNIFVIDINTRFFDFIQRMSFTRLYTFWRIVTTFASSALLPLITLITVLYIYKTKKDVRGVFEYLVSMSAGALLVVLLKNLTTYSRPVSTYAIETSYSYPSGHTALATIFALYSAHIFLKDKIALHKLAVYSLSFIFICLIGYSRLALGEHWLFDVIGGLLLGTSVTILTILTFEKSTS